MKECPRCHRCFDDEYQWCNQDGQALFFSMVGSTNLESRYKLEYRLGHGGMGVVYKGQHTFLKTHHAIKIILPELVGNDETLSTRFRHEAILAASIQHQNVINVTDFGIAQGTVPFLVMEFLQGESLAHIMKAEGRISLEKTVDLLGPICAGVGAAHKLGIVHRDLKPLNIMFKNKTPFSEGLKVLDFGLAKIISADISGSMLQLQTIGVMGSPVYMSPEQWSENSVIDNRSDIYSIGIILYQMLSGTLPFQGSSIPVVMRGHLLEKPASFYSVGLPISPVIEAVVLRALEKQPERRQQTSTELFEEFYEAVMATKASKAIKSATSGELTERLPQLLDLKTTISSDHFLSGEQSAETHYPADIPSQGSKPSQSSLEKLAEMQRLARELSESQRRAEEEARKKYEEEANLRLKEESARRRAEEEARLRAEQEAERLRNEVEEAKKFAEEEARKRAEEEARLRAELEAQRLAYEAEQAKRLAREAEEAKKRAEEETKKRAVEEARMLAIQEAERLAREIEEAKQVAKEEAKKRAEEQERLRAEEQARKRAELEAQRLAYEAEQAKQLAREAEEAKKLAEEEARKRAEEEALRHAEKQAQTKAEEEAKKRAEEEAKKQAEEEAKRLAQAEALRRSEEEARKRAEEEIARRRIAEEAHNKVAEKAKHLAREVEEAKKLAEEEAKNRAKEETRLRAELEAQRLAHEAKEAKSLAREAEEAKRIAQEEASKRAEEEARIRAEKEAEQLRNEVEKAKKLAEEEARKRAEEEARKRAEEEARKRAVEEARMLAKQEAERLAREIEEAKQVAKEEAKKRAEEQERLRAEEQARKRAELEAQRLAREVEEAKKLAQKEAKKRSANLHQTGVIQTPHKEKKKQFYIPVIIVAALGLMIVLSVAGYGIYLLVKKQNPPANNDVVNNNPRPELKNMKSISGGEFMMGTNDIDRNNPNDLPQFPEHIQIVESFWIDKTEVTNEEYAKFVEETKHQPPKGWNGNQPPAGKEKFPVVNVSIYDAEEFAKWRSKLYGRQCRLPEEKEWEYVARSGSKGYRYPWGNDFKDNAENIGTKSLKQVGSYPEGTVIGGVQDMLGNAFEWTLSKGSVYPGSTYKEKYPVGYEDKNVVRGGMFGSDPKYPRLLTLRQFVKPSFKDERISFRLVCENK